MSFPVAVSLCDNTLLSCKTSVPVLKAHISLKYFVREALRLKGLAAVKWHRDSPVVEGSWSVLCSTTRSHQPRASPFTSSPLVTLELDVSLLAAGVEGLNMVKTWEEIIHRAS